MVQPTLVYVDGQCQSNTHTQRVIIPKPKHTTLTKQWTNTQTIFSKKLTPCSSKSRSHLPMWDVLVFKVNANPVRVLITFKLVYEERIKIVS